MDIDVDPEATTKAAKSRYGALLLDELMTYLTTDKSVWVNEAPCLLSHDSKRQSKAAKAPTASMCTTPVGAVRKGNDERLRVSSAGTTCVDISPFGSMQGLLGPSCEPLCIWLAELVLTRPVTWLRDVVV